MQKLYLLRGSLACRRRRSLSRSRSSLFPSRFRHTITGGCRYTRTQQANPSSPQNSYNRPGFPILYELGSMIKFLKHHGDVRTQSLVEKFNRLRTQSLVEFLNQLREQQAVGIIV